jgi:hypothetical protein
MPVSAIAAHGRQYGIGYFFIFLALRAQLPYFFSIQCHQLPKTFLIPGKEGSGKNGRSKLSGLPAFSSEYMATNPTMINST